jgi:hypothetical protein
VILSYIFGINFGGIGIVTAQVIALICGSLIIVIAYHREHNIPLNTMIPKGNILLITVSTISLIITYYIYYSINYQSKLACLFAIIIYIVIIIMPLLIHPLMEELRYWLQIKHKI